MASALKQKKHRTSRVADMTTEDLQTMIETTLKRVLDEHWGDPDQGLEVRPEVLAGLREQDRRVAAGERGQPLSEVVRELRLE